MTAHVEIRVLNFQFCSTVPESPFSDLIRLLTDRLADLGKYQFNESMTKDELDSEWKCI